MDPKSKEMFARGSLMQAVALCGEEWVIAELIKLRAPVMNEQEQPPTPAVLTQEWFVETKYSIHRFKTIAPLK